MRRLISLLLVTAVCALRQGPRLVVEPPAVVVFPNAASGRLSCGASGSPAPVLTWVTGSGGRVDPVAGLRSLTSNHNNTTLTILPFPPDHYRHDLHQGTYRCQVTNSVGTVISRPSKVKAVVVQRFEVAVSDSSGSVGSTAVFSCDVPNTVTDHVAVRSWSVDGRTYTPTYTPDDRYWVLPTGELLVREVTATDAYSRITCTAATTFPATTPNTATSPPARVIVSDESRLTRPQLLLRRDLVRPWAGDDLLLPCVARGHPNPSVSWYYEGEGRGRVGVGEVGGRVLDGQLILKHITTERSGNYLCVANNSAGTDSYRVSLQVRQRLSAVLEPSAQRVDLGQPARLSCQVSGSPISQVTWYKDGRPLPPMARVQAYDRTLHIAQVSREDGGMYQCMVTNEQDSAQATAQIDLGDSAPVLEYRFISQTLQPGPSVSLKCIASGSPTPHVTWTLDGFPLPHLDRLVVGQYVSGGGAVVSHVNISGVRSDDGGSFQCIATNRAGTATHRARLNVYGPAYVRPMSVVTAVAEEQLVLSCPAAGYPLAKISWARDGRTLPVTARQKVYENGTLVVSRVQKPGDAGAYTCTATDTSGRDHSNTATVQVLVPPTIKPFSFGEVSEGERVQVICTVRKGDPPLTVSWLRDGAPLDNDPPEGIVVRHMDQYSSSLLMVHARARHSANYTCHATNPARTAAHSEPLVVKVPPSWVSAPRDTAVTLGGSAVIPCYARGFPAPSVTWRRSRGDGSGQYGGLMGGGLSPLGPLGRPGLGAGVGVGANGSLVVVGARPEDRGQYLCEANNGVGGGLSSLVTLTVHVPPRFEAGQRRVAARRGSSTKLACVALGDAPMTLVWRHAHTHVHHQSSVHEIEGGVRGELVVAAVDTRDAGDYTCTATNAFGTDTFTVTLVVQDVPGPPHGLSVVQRGSRYLSVSWLPPTTAHSPIHNYVTQYRPAPGPWSDTQEVQVVQVAGDVTSARLGPLVPNTQYLVRVSAANHLGQSVPSEPLQVMTEGEPPSSPPLNVRSDALSASSVRVTWDSPPPHTHHGDLLGYHLGLRAHVGSSESYNYSVVGLGHGGGGREVVTGLRAWVEYALVVRAYNAHGHGPTSQPLVVRTLEDVPGAPPSGIECVAGVDGASLVVRWSPPPSPAHNGVLRGYQLTLTHLDDSTDHIGEVTRAVAGREEVVTGLLPWSNYTVSVAALTRAGAGVASADLTCTTREDVAGVPAGLRAGQAGVDSAVVTWLPPVPATGVLLGYTLSHRPPHATTPSKHPIHAHATSHTLTHLAHGIHQFWLTARTRVGEGPPTATIKLQMLPSVSAAVVTLGRVVVVREGDDVRLECVVLGSPPSPPSWTRGGVTIPTNNRVTVDGDGSLVIRAAERTDRGNYTCSVRSARKSPYVHTASTHVLHVQVPPAAPSVRITDATVDSVTVSWSGGDSGGAPIRSWSLWWRVATGGGVWHTRDLSRSTTTHVIHGLQCGAQYQVYVTGRTAVGVSAPSVPLSARTSGSAPVPPATHLVAGANSTGVWAFLNRWHDGGCPITHFTLELRRHHDASWTTLGSSVAPQDVYEVGGLAVGARFGLRVTGHNGAGATSTVVYVTTGPGGGVGARPLGGPHPPSHHPMHSDPRILASAAASALALSLTVAAAVLCCRRRLVGGRGGLGGSEDQENEQNKTNLLNQRDAYYATVRKPQPVPATLDRIPGTCDKDTEHSEDIYPYATFQPGENRISADDTTLSNKFQTYVFQDSRYGVTEGHPPTSSDTDTEHGTSSRTESSNQLDSTLDHRSSVHLPLDVPLVPLQPRPEPQQPRPQRQATRTVHHNLIYHAPESSTSTEPSPVLERKSFPRRNDAGRSVAGGSRGGGRCGPGRTAAGVGRMVAKTGPLRATTQETCLSFPKGGHISDSKGSDDGKYGFTRQITPPVAFSSSHNELSEAECDLEITRRTQNQEPVAPTYLGHVKSQFRSYVSTKDKDYSIKV